MNCPKCRRAVKPFKIEEIWGRRGYWYECGVCKTEFWVRTQRKKWREKKHG